MRALFIPAMNGKDPIPSRRGLLTLLLILFLAMTRPAAGVSQVDPQAVTRDLWNQYLMAGNDSLKIEKLSRLAHFCNDYCDDPARADSFGSLAVRIAEASHRPGLVLLAGNLYAESIDLHRFNARALGYLLRAWKLASSSNDQEAVYRTGKNLAAAYQARYRYDMALDYQYRALSVANLTGNAARQVGIYLAIGENMEGKNQKIEAFRSYLTASSLAEKANDPALLADCYDRLSRFYNQNRMFAKAIRYKLMQEDLVRNRLPADSAALMWIAYDLQVIDQSQDDRETDETGMMKILDYARRHRHQRMMNYAIALYRSRLVEKDDIGRLRALYYRRFPEEWSKLAVADRGMYYRLMAFFSEDGDRPDSALHYFLKAAPLVDADPNRILQSKFYYRFGQFLMRQGRKEEARGKFTLSYELANRVSYFDYMVLAAGQLEKLSQETGDFKNAYHYAVINRALADSLGNLARRDELLVMDVDHETRQREWFAGREKEKTLRRHSLQYSAITIGILTVFVVLIMLGSLKVPGWIIRMLGFFSFIFLFEFIILLADKEIHEITHGEPWKVLLIKIFLIAILLPLHHLIEKKVINYLLTHKLLNLSGSSLVMNLRRQADKIRKNTNTGN